MIVDLNSLPSHFGGVIVFRLSSSHNAFTQNSDWAEEKKSPRILAQWHHADIIHVYGASAQDRSRYILAVPTQTTFQ